MYLTILFLPALGAFGAGLFGRKIGVTGSHIITTSCLFISAILSIIGFYEVVLTHSPVTIYLSNWVQSELLDIQWSFTFDTLTISIIATVLIISSLVHLYSIDYISSDPHNQRFFSYLSMFTFFMLILVSGDNYFVLFVGWEFIAISSFLLINFWFTIIEANKSAMQSFIVNRVGDISLTVAFFVIFFIFGNVDFATVFNLSPIINENGITILGLLLLFGGMGKSAQIGLHTWLPTAMAGPTPVSSLIHSATLVSAGVYVLLRSSPILEYAPTALIATTWIGSITAFFAASTGLFQNDIKRVIAYSTCSQMGYLFLACGLSQYNTALFHLVNHAFFKALLFLSAGAVLHATFDQQDQRRQGGMLAFLPFTYTSMIIGSLSLIAIPFMTGFYSKDLILELAYSQYVFHGSIAYWFGSISAGLTAFYSFRLISITFMSYPNSTKKIYESAHDAAIFAIIPITILSLLAIFFGYIGRDLFVGMGTDFAGTSLFTHPSHISLIEAEVLPSTVKLLPTILTFGAATLAFSLYNFAPRALVSFSKTKLGYNLYKFFNSKYYIEVLYNSYIIPGALGIGYFLSKRVDRGLVEQLFAYGVASGLSTTSKEMKRLDTGNLTSYTLYFALMLVIMSILLMTPVLIVISNSTITMENLSWDNNIINTIYNIVDIRLLIVIILSFIIVNSGK